MFAALRQQIAPDLMAKWLEEIELLVEVLCSPAHAWF